MVDNLNSLYMRDPAAAIRQRQLLRAQQMQQEGSSSAPVAHWAGGLNRIMQAVMGRLDENRLMGEQRAETEGRQDEASNFARGLASHMTPQGAQQAQQAVPGPAVAPVAREALPAPVEPTTDRLRTAGVVPAGYRLGGPASAGAGVASPGLRALTDDVGTRRQAVLSNDSLSPDQVQNELRLIGTQYASAASARAASDYGGAQPQPSVNRIGAALLGQQPAPTPNAAPAPQAAQPGAGPTGMNAILAMAMKGQGSDNPMVREAAARAMQTAALMGTQSDRREDNARADRAFAFQQGQAADNSRRADAHLAIAQREPAESFGAPTAMQRPDGTSVYVRPGNRGTMQPVDGYAPPAAGQFEGNSVEAQSLNILLAPNANVNSPAYGAAFSRLYAPRTVAQADGSIITINPPVPEGVRRPGSGGNPAPVAQPNAAQPDVATGGAAPAPVGGAPPPRVNSTQTPGGGNVTVQQGTGGNLTEPQGRSNLFGMAMFEGNRIIGESAIPSNATIMAWRNAPEAMVNMGLNENDQSYFNALRQFAAGVLRKETGAAFGPNELADVQSRFFAMPGDTPLVRQQKSRARLQAIEGMRAEIPGGFRGQLPPPPSAGGAPPLPRGFVEQ